MSQPLASSWQPNKWYVFGAVSLVFFFLNLATFTSLGVVLYTMVGELHWSMTAAGFSFTFLGLACGLSSPLPALTMKWVGGRATVCLGAALLVLGFFLASISHSLFAFYVAMLFLGLGYSLGGNVPAMYLITGWFERGSSRIIGYYLMLGALGAACGPPIVVEIVSGSGGWRGHWAVMSIAAAVIGIVCLICIRDAKAKPVVSADDALGVFGAVPKVPPASAERWSPKEAVFTPQFMLIAAAMTITMACVTTNSSITVSHLVKLGATPTGAAFVLSAIAIIATLVKGGAGRLCETVTPTHLCSGGLVLQAIGCVMLAFANTALLQYLSALAYGTGWGLSYVAGTIVLLNYFGPVTGSKILSIVWLITTLAAAGPMTAGMIADHYGTFAPIYIIYAAILVVLALPIFLMRQPREAAQEVARPNLKEAATHIGS